MPGATKKMKPTPVGEIPKGWKCFKLGELLEFSQYGLSESSTEEGVPYLKMSNIRDGKVIWNPADKLLVSEEDLEKYCLKKGDLLFNRTNSLALVGKTGVCPDDAQVVFASYLVRLRTNDKANPFHLIHWFNSAHGKDRLKALATPGVSQSNINPTVLKKRFFVPLPPIPEQRKIANILGTWDRAIETQQQLIDSLTRRKKALMQQLLTGNTRLPGFEGAPLIDTHWGKRPACWHHCKIEDIAKQSQLKNKENKPLPVLSCTKHHGLVDSLTYFKKQIYSDDLSNYRVVKHGDFAYATNHIEEGSIGVQEIHKAALVSPIYTVFRTNPDICDEFLFPLLKTDLYIHIYRVMTSSSVDRRGSLRWKEFSKIPVAIPPLEEQKAIAQVLTTADREITQHTQHLDALRTQKRGLMQQLLTGKTRVTV